MDEENRSDVPLRRGRKGDDRIDQNTYTPALGV